MRSQVTFLIVLLGVILNSTVLSWALEPQDAEVIFRTANEAYRANDFERAVTLYHELETSGVISADLFYNLGTAYAQLGKTGDAVAYLERARRLAPYDKDIVANLEMVSPPGNTTRPFVLLVPFLALRDSMSCEAWIWVCTAIFAFTMLVWSTLLLMGKPSTLSRGLSWAAVLLSAVCAILAAWSYHDTYLTRQVVTRTEAPVYSGPSQSFSRLLTAKEGQKFPTLPYDNPHWKRVELPTGQTGFIQAEHVHDL
ncbi:MAG: tetratricopeptide repeat protein [Candidatus Sumerlaeaceae bacterium]|nr:tetratricopeptide repeat protein [Candidatus Sumerlaeaceae bacterium]